MFEPDKCYGIVQFRCINCNEVVDYLYKEFCYDCRYPDTEEEPNDDFDP